MIEIDTLEWSYLLSSCQYGQDVLIFELVDIIAVATDERLQTRAVLGPGLRSVLEQTKKLNIFVVGIRVSLIPVLVHSQGIIPKHGNYQNHPRYLNLILLGNEMGSEPLAAVRQGACIVNMVQLFKHQGDQFAREHADR